ncbi:hypothetical protein GGP86_000222 [Salinibacter ruber]|uniref:hypothetical protein n=1 Tax=Salinibacter ruber TaxID=146919 RepID=UPI002166CDFC|nr:hypothetical protein [Salinibacter ruber]MCS3860474.1 hypothetical protein [Salinibacter ruber]
MSADTIYVDKGASGAGDGTSWTDAYTSLQDALQAARSNGTDDAVWVAAGTYYPDEGASANADDNTESFRVESGIDLRGHFSGDEQSLGDRTLARGGPKTVLSGEIQQDGTQSNNAYTVLRITGGSAGELHVQGGAANGSGPQRRGGGAYVTGGTLHHAVLTGNRARRGAALFATGSPVLEVLRVTGNHATEAGALYFSGDTSTAGHLTVADNTAGSGPTGLYFIGSDAAIEDIAAGPNTTSTVAERIQITFNPKTVGDTLYTGGYEGELDYTVSTDDTTFTTTGSTTADVPIADNDELEISTSDSEYLSTVVANNTDTEQPPFQVSGFPDEPDYQNTTISIPKSDVVNEYQVVGFPNTSTDGRDMETTFLPHINNATRFTERQADGETLDEVATYIIDSGDSGWNDKAENAIADVRDVLPYPSTQPSILPDLDALVDSANARNEFNYHYTEQGANGNNAFRDSGYIKSTTNSFSDSAVESTRISEVYSAMSDMDEIGDNNMIDYIIDDDGSFDADEAELALRFEYNTLAGSTLQP